MENQPCWWYVAENMVNWHDYVSLQECTVYLSFDYFQSIISTCSRQWPPVFFKNRPLLCRKKQKSPIHFLPKKHASIPKTFSEVSELLIPLFCFISSSTTSLNVHFRLSGKYDCGTSPLFNSSNVPSHMSIEQNTVLHAVKLFVQ